MLFYLRVGSDQTEGAINVVSLFCERQCWLIYFVTISPVSNSSSDFSPCWVKVQMKPWISQSLNLGHTDEQAISRLLVETELQLDEAV